MWVSFVVTVLTMKAFCTKKQLSFEGKLDTVSFVGLDTVGAKLCIFMDIGLLESQ